MSYSQENKKIRVKILLIVSLLLSLAEFQPASPAADEHKPKIIDRSAIPDHSGDDLKAALQPRSADDLLIVDCLLPGQFKRLGKVMTYLTPSRPVKTTALDCETRGGQFASSNQSNELTALSVWLPQAEDGDPLAQTYVGEIYQKGLSTAPQYDLAAIWYRKAADQGFIRAQRNLAYLYENGQGVEKDFQEALYWYRRAAGKVDTIALNEKILSIEERQELVKLRREVERRKEEAGILWQQLGEAQIEKKRTLRELEAQRRNLKLKERELERARLELALRKKATPELAGAELEELKLEVKRHETEVERQRREAAMLQSEIAIVNEKAQSYRNMLSTFEQIFANLPAPRIEIYDLSPQLTRGVRYETDNRDKKRRLLAGTVWAPAGLASFEVNEKPEPVEPDGKFRVWIPLNPSGGTNVHLTAIDQRGKSTSIIHQLARNMDIPKLDLTKPEVESVNFGHYYALIIGNSNYRNLPDLKTPVNDAREVAELLRDKYGFKLSLLLDASRYEILRALEQYINNLSENDNLLIYYSGHGHLDAANNRGYWLPVDAAPDSTANWIPNYAITDMLNIMAVKSALIISDSSYSGSLTRGVIARPESGQNAELRLQYIKELAKGRTRMVLTSGELAPVMDTGGGNHSVFANVLLDVLATNDQIIEGSRLYQEMSARVVSESKMFGLTQVPQYSANTQAGHESGDFIFVPVENN